MGIELEVMELRASLEMQGLHRDAIEDICDEKRQRLIEEQEASLASPRLGEDSKIAPDSPETSSSESEAHRRREKEKAKLAKEKEKEKEREREREAEKEREREKEKEKEKE